MSTKRWGCRLKLAWARSLPRPETNGKDKPRQVQVQLQLQLHSELAAQRQAAFFKKKPPPTTPRKLLQLSWRLLSRKGRGDNPDAVVKVLMMIVMMFEAKPIVGEEKTGKKERENVGPSSSKGQREEIVTKRKAMKKKGRGKGRDKRQDKRDGRCISKQSPKRRPPKKGTSFRTAGTIPMIARTGSTDNNGRVPKKAVPLVPFDCSSTSFLPCIERAADGRARN